MKILIVDDEELALSSLQRVLRRRGYGEVDLCQDGLGAVERIKGGNYDFVFLDLVMPGMDGLQVLEATKAHVPECTFIMLTAVDDADTVAEAQRLGAADYLVKPVEAANLFAILDSAGKL